MPDPHRISLYLSILALVAPLLAFGLIMLTGRHRPKLSATVSIGAIGLSLVSATWLLFRHFGMMTPISFELTWLSLGNLKVPLGILLDPISLVMMVIVAGIGFLVQLYSLGYMAGDPGFGRYYR